MKTNRHSFLLEGKSLAGGFAPLRSNWRYRVLSVLLLLLGALQLHLFAASAVSESPKVGEKTGNQKWSVQIERVDPGDVSLEPSFRTAIYENLIEELAKSNQFKEVFRSGDRNGNDVPGLLILKTTVRSYTPGSETRRAVTTVTGATKLSVRIQLVERDGNVVLDQAVNGNVRFIGSNLRATHNLAHHVAQRLKLASLPKRPDTASEAKAEKTSN